MVKSSPFAVGAVFSSSAGSVLFGGSGADQFIKHCLNFSRSRAENPSEALDVFADAAGTGKYHADCRRGNVNALIENLAGHQTRVSAVAETVKEIFAFGASGVVGYHREREVSADGVGAVIVGGENDNAFTGVALKNPA
jgi:hypothetical protein